MKRKIVKCSKKVSKQCAMTGSDCDHAICHKETGFCHMGTGEEYLCKHGYCSCVEITHSPKENKENAVENRATNTA